jgi:hypothetical protein
MASYTFNNSGGNGLWSNLSNWTGSPTVPPLNATNGSPTDTITINAAACTQDISLAFTTGTVQFSTTACTFNQNSGVSTVLSGAGSWNAAATPANSVFAYNGAINVSAGVFNGCFTNPASVTLSSTSLVTMAGGAINLANAITSGSPVVTSNGLIQSTGGSPTFMACSNCTVVTTVNITNTAALASNFNWSAGTLFFASTCSAKAVVTSSSAVVGTISGTGLIIYSGGSSVTSGFTSTINGTWIYSSTGTSYFCRSVSTAVSGSSLNFSGTLNQSAGVVDGIGNSVAGISLTLSGQINVTGGTLSVLNIVTVTGCTANVSGGIAVTSGGTVNFFGSAADYGTVTVNGGVISSTGTSATINAVNSTNGSLNLSSGSFSAVTGATLKIGMGTLTYSSACPVTVNGMPVLPTNNAYSELQIGTANTLSLNAPPYQTFYVIAQDSSGFSRLADSPPTNEAYNASNWSAHYALAMSDANNIGQYVATIPANLPANTYSFFAYRQVGASASPSDASPVSTVRAAWSSSMLLDPVNLQQWNGSNITTSVPASGGSVNVTQWGGTNVTGMPMPTYTQPTGFLAASFPASVGSSTLTQAQVTGGAYAIQTDTSGNVKLAAAQTFTNSNSANLTGDAYQYLVTNHGLLGANATALAPASTALSTATWTNAKAGYLDTNIGSRMATYTQPAGFLAAAFPASVGTSTVTDASIATDVQAGLTAQGYTTARAGYLDALNGIVASVWGYATRILTAGTNIVLVKGTGVTGFNDIAPGSQMDLVNAPNATAITAIQNGLSKPGTAQTITPADTAASNAANAIITQFNVSGIALTTAQQAALFNASNFTGQFSTGVLVNAASATSQASLINTLAGYITSSDASLADIQTTTDELANMIVAGVFKASALANTPTGGGGGGSGTGIYAVQIQFQDSSGTMVPNVAFSIVGQSINSSANASGGALVNLNADTYHLNARATAAVQFASNIPLVVTGTQGTIVITGAGITTPTSPPGTINAKTRVIGPDGTLLANSPVTYKAMYKNTSTGFSPATNPKTVYSDAFGNITMPSVPGISYCAYQGLTATGNNPVSWTAGNSDVVVEDIYGKV